MRPEDFLTRVITDATPTAMDRSAAARNRAALNRWAETTFMGNYGFRETGSWSHGTAVRSMSDVDYFLSLRGARPSASKDTLESLRASLAIHLWNATVTINRPAVRAQFNDDSPDIEIVPAYLDLISDDYLIPDPVSTGWIRSNPRKHLAYVNSAHSQEPGAKKFIRLVKSWNHYQNVGLSSFYLEMRAAKHVLNNPPLLLLYDFCWLLNALHDGGLASMNDPSQFDGRRIEACPQVGRTDRARLVGIYTDAACKARELANDGSYGTAQVWLDFIFHPE